jgi:uncharacterized protein
VRVKQVVNHVHRILTPDIIDSTASGKCALAIMTKAPRPGEVKTRLTPPLTPPEAAALNQSFLQDIAATVMQAGGNTTGIACYTPIGCEAIYQGILPSGFALLPQRGATFGDRLRLAAEDLFSTGFTSVCLIGSDSPTVPAASYGEAARLLSQADDSVVLGPTEDGGYYLIGMNKIYPELFAKIDWSTDCVFQQTLDRAAEISLPVYQLQPSLDIDDGETLGRLCELLLTQGHSEMIRSAPATKAFLQELIEKEGRNRIWPVEQGRRVKT